MSCQIRKKRLESDSSRFINNYVLTPLPVSLRNDAEECCRLTLAAAPAGDIGETGVAHVNPRARNDTTADRNERVVHEHAHERSRI